MSRMPLADGWSNEPRPQEQMYRVPLLRVRKGESLSVVFLVAMFPGRFLHWNGNRNVPCIENDCKMCANNYRRDWKMYGPVWLPGRDAVAMLELPYSALKYFQQQYMRHMTAYGFHAEIGRVGDNNKGKVVVQFRHAYKGATPLPEGPDPVAYMSRVWGIYHPDPSATDDARPDRGAKVVSQGRKKTTPEPINHADK